MKSALRIFNKSQGGSTPRGIYYAKYYGQVGGNGAGKKKMKNEAVRNKMKKKEKGKKGKGERKKKKRKRGRDIFLLIYATLLLIIVY